MKKHAHAASVRPASKPEAERPKLAPHVSMTGDVRPERPYDSKMGRVRTSTKLESDPVPAIGE